MYDPRLCGLYAITPDNIADCTQLCTMVEAAAHGGARLVQYRDKHASTSQRAERAAALTAVCARLGLALIINDDLELALTVGAAGVHLGRDDGDASDARRRAGADFIIGISCYDRLDTARAAVRSGASYVAFGACFPSSTKPAAAHATPALLTAARRELPVPIVAIGGITPENGPLLVSAGAHMLAVISGLFARSDIAATARAYTALFSQERIQMTQSHELFVAAQRHIPGGVNSPVRAFRGVGGDPVFFKRAEGAYAYDVDGKRYIDYVGSWGPMILGHAHPAVLDAVRERLTSGLSFGAPTALETTMADKVCELIPSMEMVRMVSSGTEATMSALRLARGFTGRDKIVKFEGCYHGHGDSLLVNAGSGALTLGQPSSPGVPKALAELTLTLRYNDIDQVREVFGQIGREIACIIVEPVAGNMNCIPPAKGFLEGLREVCDEYGTVLIFDEVMTGFRVALGGAQAHFGVRPDLTTLGKVIGGGMPVGAFGGKAEIMSHISPLGPVYQAGTLSGNPIAMAAGLKTLEIIAAPGFYQQLTANAETLLAGLRAAAQSAGVPFTTNQAGGMFGLFFSDTPVTNFEQATACDRERFNRFFHAMLERGVYLAPSAFEAGFISIAHGNDEIDATIKAAEEAFKAAAH